jgi:TolA-binding protein
MALKNYIEFLNIYPSSYLRDRVHFRLGEIYLKLKNYTRAIRHFKNSLEFSKDNSLISQSAYWIGEIYFKMDDFKNALKYYSISYEAMPDGNVAPYSLFSMAWIYEKEKNFTKAKEHYEKLLSEFSSENVPTRILNETKLHLINCYFNLENYIDVIRAGVDLLVSTNTENRSQILYLIAESYYRLNQLDSAQIYFEKFINEYPDDKLASSALYSLGWIKFKMKDYSGAISIFDSLSGLEGKIGMLSLFHLAKVKKISGDTSGAIADYRKFLNRFDAKYDDDLKYVNLYTRANLELGLIYFDAGQYDSASIILEKLSENASLMADSNLRKLTVEGLKLLARSYLKLDNYAQALRIFRLLKNEFELIKDDKADVLLGEGLALMKLGEFQMAVQIFKEIISKFKDYPRFEEALFYLAESYYRTGNFKLARENYLKILNKFPKTERKEEVLYSIAWTYFKERNYSEAAKHFGEFLKEFRVGNYALDAKLRIADCYYLLKDFDKALKLYLSYVRLHPRERNADYAYFQIAQIYLKQRRVRSALGTLQLIRKRYPDSPLIPNVMYQMGWIYFRDKNYNPAIASFREVARMYPDHQLAPKSLYAIGDSYYNMEEYEFAIKAYLKVIERYPESKYAGDAVTGIQYCLSAQGKDPELVDDIISKSGNSTFYQIAMLKKAEFQFLQKQYSEAIKTYRKFIKTYPRSKKLPEAIFNLARTYELEGKHLEAKEIYINLISRYPLNPFSQRALVQLGKLKIKEKDYLKAIEFFSKVGTDADVYDEALYLSGICYLALGDTVNAVRKFSKVIDEFTNSDYSDRSKVEMGKILLAQGKPDDALELFKSIVKNRTPDEISAEAQYQIAETMFKSENIDEAILQYLRVRYLFGEHRRFLLLSYLRLSECYEKKGDIKRAIQFLNEVIKLSTDKDIKSQAERRLTELKIKSKYEGSKNDP